MSKMFETNYLSENKITCTFAQDRSKWSKPYGPGLKHEGIDYGHMNMKKIYLKNMFDGIVSFSGEGGPYGKCVQVEHNPFFSGGANNPFYSQYCHLDMIDNNINISKFLDNGDPIGKMGCTGNSQGVHLHFMCFQYSKGQQKSLLLDDILDKLNIKLSDDVAFWQWNKLYFNPEIMMKYFEKIQEGK